MDEGSKDVLTEESRALRLSLIVTRITLKFQQQVAELSCDLTDFRSKQGGFRHLSFFGFPSWTLGTRARPATAPAAVAVPPRHVMAGVSASYRLAARACLVRYFCGASSTV